MRIGIIGGGFMGEAFLRGIVRAGVAQPSEIAVAEVVEARRIALSEHGVRVTDDPESALYRCGPRTVAVKPQDSTTPSSRCEGRSRRPPSFISIAAGVELGRCSAPSGHAACVRGDADLPAAIGEGAAVFLASRR